ncbi:membrane hypothetical protein [Bradyrhizobium sp. ORS 375]|uniref:DUF2975 domain-containing protein n=1 Tax=Bradyrhizobium sp. (strain ORS 375) TaxID=566679 RepID=UPI0002406913|nr:DUF2975 domain-containing protein [Bradyrhizobium sp. ORS 375]CCD92491.1 membrane hypothetical protein [Bradyrhizobium sp. ORS 375]
MSVMAASAEFGDVPAAQTALRRRIAWVCRAIRLAAVLWVAWLVVEMAWSWWDTDRARYADGLGRALGADLTGLSQAQIDGMFVMNAGVLACDAVVAYFLWRLFGTYLLGRIFTVDAAVWMHRVGLAGLVAMASGVVFRKLALLILTRHAEVPAATLWSFQAVLPSDLLWIIFCLFVVAVAQIFKAAAELADDHAKIV